jgi:hypothetical protein
MRMRDPPYRKKTERGIGEPEELDEVPPPSSRRGVSCTPPMSQSVRPAGRYSLTPARRETVDLPLERTASQPDAAELAPPPRSRVPTTRMPSCVEETGPVSVAWASRLADKIVVRKQATPSKMELAPLSSQDAFVLSLIEGATSMQALVDTTAIEHDALAAILDRLVGLGFLGLEDAD